MKRGPRVSGAESASVSDGLGQVGLGPERFRFRALLIPGGLAFGWLVAEALLWGLDLPRSFRPPIKSPQFKIAAVQDADFLVYTSLPSASIRFTYDGNPRGYFGAENEVDHVTNARGFRGPEFHDDKPPHTIRIAFLGDSFTFGEGVRFDDTYPEVLAALLGAQVKERGVSVEAYNFGVGGYNTAHEFYAMIHFALQTEPDIVVLGYALNDAEPPIFDFNPKGRDLRPIERRTEASTEVGTPDNLFFHLRVPRLIWSFFALRARNARWEKYYESLYGDGNAGWKKTRDSIQQIAGACREKKLPVFVLEFPLLYELTARYPFKRAHELVQREFASAGIPHVDLLPLLVGKPAESLWVHPTDQHPNEKVHRAAAEALARLMLNDAGFQASAARAARRD